jgi:hypothetical protein
MKPISILLIIATGCILLYVHCSKNPTLPTQPSHYEQLKNTYIALTGQLETELENFRGKKFKRPVTTAVFTLAQYKRIAAQTGGSSPTPTQVKLYNDIFKAEGLMGPHDDYFAGEDSIMANETGGFYKDGSDSIFVILDDTATGLSWFDSMTIFHELTHAMQDQSINLTAIDAGVQSSDQSYGLQYTLEGEAELFSFYYGYKYNGAYPPGSRVMMIFDTMAVIINKSLDSIHYAGGMLLTEMPFDWAYFSYGLKFINAVAGRNWATIDANIYPLLPIKTCVELHPENFPNEYALDFDPVAGFIDSTQTLDEVDELGEVLMNVLFRQWNFPDYLQLSTGLLADNIAAYRTKTSDSVRIAWYTYWQNETESAAFFTNIAKLIGGKKNITLPAAVQYGDTSIVSDTVNKVYIETDSGHVFVLEDYQPARLQELVSRMRSVTWRMENGTALAKKAAQAKKKYPFIDKSKQAKIGRRNRMDRCKGTFRRGNS